MKKLDKELLKYKVISNLEKDFVSKVIGGAAVIVAQSGETVLDERRGYSDVEKRIPIFGDSIFRLASMTKPITAVAVLIAEERGYFSLSDPISSHFPEFGQMLVGRLEGGRVIGDHRQRETPTLRDLLTHTSGFMCNSPLCEPQQKSIPASEFESAGRVVDYAMKNTFLTFDPCEATGYGAHFPFDLLEVLIERKSGMKYSDFVNNNILFPLKMKDTTYFPTEEQWGRTVIMCDRKSPDKIVNVEMGRHTFESYPLSYTSGGAGLVGTIRDYLVFAEMLRRGGEYEGVRILSDESVMKMRTPQVSRELIGENGTTTWGLSVRIILDGYPFLTPGSYGWSGAYGTHFFIDPENEITAIYMKNTRWFDSRGAGNTGRHFEADVTASLV